MPKSVLVPKFHVKLPGREGNELAMAQKKDFKQESIATAIDPHADEFNNPPYYLPQPEDQFPREDNLKPMGPIGSWATGKVDWSPMAGLTGTRPVVDRYSITRFSPNEWRANNLQIIKNTNDVFGKTMKNEYSCKSSLVRINSLAEKAQMESTENMRQRAQLIGKWKNNLAAAIKAMQDEIIILEEEKLRLQKSLVILGVPAAIAKECLDLRCGRADTELVRDAPEEELISELALIAEVKQLVRKTLEDCKQQQIENRTVCQRLEYDWSDKKEAYEIDALNAGLSNKSTAILFKPGAVRQPAEQPSEEYWEQFSQKNLEECEICRQKSFKLRQTVNSILMNAARDLRTQADNVEKAFANRVISTQESLQRFENDLKECLQKLADTETRITKLSAAIRSYDPGMKVAQTRLDNRSFRPNLENCRDAPQRLLIDEVATIQSGVNVLLLERDESECVKNKLIQTRSTLEREIMLKRRTLMLDRERCMLLRAHYPSASALSGFGSD